MLHFSCYRLKPGGLSTTILLRVAIFVYYNCISQNCCGMETEYSDPEWFKYYDFFRVGHLDRYVSHLYRTFQFFVGQTDKTDTFQELWLPNLIQGLWLRLISAEMGQGWIFGLTPLPISGQCLSNWFGKSCLYRHWTSTPWCN
jgi:hypothetical protein